MAGEQQQYFSERLTKTVAFKSSSAKLHFIDTAQTILADRNYLISYNDVKSEIIAEALSGVDLSPYSTLVGIETLTNKTLTSPILNGTITGSAVLDDDTMATATATTLATSESIKTYVDNQISATVSVSNQADNRIITATGVVDDLNAESTLTFDGTTLGVNNVNITTIDYAAAGTESPIFTTEDGKTLSLRAIQPDGTSGGILLPNFDTTARNLMTPSSGWTIWNTTANEMQVYNGSTWDSIGQGLSLSNGSNNRIITATGVDGLNAESALTFDGTDMVVEGNLLVGTIDSTEYNVSIGNNTLSASALDSPLSVKAVNSNEYSLRVFGSNEAQLLQVYNTSGFSNQRVVEVGNTLKLKDGTITAADANETSLYSADADGAGTNSLHIETENGFTIKLYPFGNYTAATGTASRATFDTATVTLSELAQKVKAMIDDFIEMGIFR